MSLAVNADRQSQEDVAGQSLLEVRDLTVSFGSGGHRLQVLDGVSFSVTKDEVVCLVGESGSGKSVSAMTCVGLTLHAGARIDGGSILFCGEELVGTTTRRWNQLRGGQVGFVFQEPMTSLNPAFTIGNQIMEVLRQHKRMPRREARARAEELLRLVGLSEPRRRIKEYPHHLSGGMRQRVMMAIAIAADPLLLIADEPTTALDVTVQATILELVQDLKAELGMGVLLITHDLGVVAEIADRVVVMYAGQVVEAASSDDAFERPLHPYTSGLMRSLPQQTGPGEPFGSIPGVVPAPGQMPPGCRFLPRCPHAEVQQCATVQHERAVGLERRVRCVRSDQIKLEGT